MNIRHHINEKAVYRAVNTGILACICLFTPEALLGFSAVTVWNFLVLGIVTAFFVSVSFLKARGRVLCVLTAFVGIGISAAVIGRETSIAFLGAYLQWCSGSRIAQAEWLKGCQLMQTAAVAAGCYLVQMLSERLRMLRMGLAWGCILVLAVCLFARVELSQDIVAFMILYVIVVYVEWLQERWKKSRSGGFKEQMVWLSPFLALYVLVLSRMPAPTAPYDWQWAKQIGHQIKESFLIASQNFMRGGREDFGVSFSGFSGDGELGEGFEDDAHEVMQVQGQGSLVTNVYLIGKVYDTFDGKQWVQNYHENHQERFLDTMETLYAVRRLDGRNLKDYLSETELKIRYEFFNTRYLFAPLKAEHIRSEAPGLEYTFEGGDLLLPKTQGYGTEYYVRYYQLNMGEELFDQLLDAEQEADAQLWENIAGEYEEALGRKAASEAMEAHRQRIYDYYLDEAAVSEDVERYLEAVTEGAVTDMEKLQAIEKELSSYTYTNMPGKMPDSVTNASEFLDYFLLESKTGYCAYFATAFVLLARLEGIPARYAQGFCVPVEGSGYTAVLSNMAHAWPEVYMEGVGWIPFEPTPGYRELRYTPWKVKDRNAVIFYEEEEEEDEEDEEELLTEDSERDIMPGAAGEENGSRVIWLFALGVPALITGYLLVLASEYLLCAYRYQRMDQEGKFKTEVRKNIRVLAWLGLVRGSRETLQEMRRRGMEMLGGMQLRFIEDYESVVYGDKQVGEEMMGGVKEEREQLMALVRREKKLAYMFYRMKLPFQK